MAISFSKPLLPDLKEVMARVRPGWEAGSVTKGPLLAEYEKAICDHLNVKEGVAVSSCTTGLILTLQSLGITGKCLVPAFTFTATVGAILWNQLKPVFVDCHPKKFTVFLDALESAYSPEIKAMVATYIFGNPPPLKALSAFCEKHHLPLIIDAAHGFGSTVYGHPPGQFGKAEVFSTSPTKLLCTGEGGFVATNDRTIANALHSLREYGHGKNYETIALGQNGRMTEFQAATGLLALPLLSDHAKRRNRLAELYKEALKNLPLSFQEIEPQCQSSYKDFAIVLEDGWKISRDELASRLEKRGVPTRKYFAPALHLQSFFKSRSEAPGGLANTERICSKILCLPIHSDLTEKEIESIAAVLIEIFNEASK